MNANSLSTATKDMKEMKDSRNARPFVIAIGGPSGSGKSSLVYRIVSLLGDAMTLFFDDYASVSTYPSDFGAWIRDGAKPDEWKTPRLAVDLAALRQGQPILPPDGAARRESARYIVIEEPFGRERQEMRDLIDLVAIVDLPLEVALARRIRRNIQSGLHDSAASIECLQSLDQFLNAYLDGPLREGYIAINRVALKTSDVVLDGMKPIDELADQVVQAVRARTR
ncbi:MAG TPA: hypothetical protein VKT80_12250 [Chloroflexota bacterium]|nr:hypothetical protein [Chloroflexota bacterium]